MPEPEPMLARHVDHFPAHGPYVVYEPKWDGFRCIATTRADGEVRLVSRRAKSMTQSFPDVAAVVERFLPPSTTVDGEIVRWGEDGRLDFPALQERNRAGRNAHHLAKEAPAHYVVFDLLQCDGSDLRGRPLSERRQLLEELFTTVGIPATSPLALGMQTSDENTAHDWYEKLGVVGIEGLVIKDTRTPYVHGERSWLKLKKFLTVEAIVGGVTGSLDRPRSVVLGRYSRDTGELIVVARTVEIRDTKTAADLGRSLTAAGDDHPWPLELPPSWTAVLYGASRGPTQYVRVRPDLVAEIRVDAATGDQRWRHGSRYLRPRPDLDPTDVPNDLDIEA